MKLLALLAHLILAVILFLPSVSPLTKSWSLYHSLAHSCPTVFLDLLLIPIRNYAIFLSSTVFLISRPPPSRPLSLVMPSPLKNTAVAAAEVEAQAEAKEKAVGQNVQSDALEEEVVEE